MAASQKSEDSGKIELFDYHIQECLIRLPLSHHFLLPAISKKLNELVKTREIFEERARLKIKETLIQVGFSNSSVDHRMQWFAIIKKGSWNEFVLRPVMFPSIPEMRSAWVGAGNRAFSFCNIMAGKHSTNEVFCVKCGSGSTVVVETKTIHHNPATAVVRDKLYVFGGECLEDEDNFLEVFDLKNNTWNSVHVPEEDQKDIRSAFRTATMVLSNKIYLFDLFNLGGKKCLVFDPETGMIERRDDLSVAIPFNISCVINNLIVSIRSGSVIEIFDTSTRYWSVLRGLEHLPKWNIFKTKLMNYKDNLLVLHQPTLDEFCITEIKFERSEGQIWGYVISSNSLILQKPAELLEAITVEI